MTSIDLQAKEIKPARNTFTHVAKYIGGDKPVTGLTPEGEANPFLGRVLTGRVRSGSVKANQAVKALARDGKTVADAWCEAHGHGPALAYGLASDLTASIGHVAPKIDKDAVVITCAK